MKSRTEKTAEPRLDIPGVDKKDEPATEALERKAATPKNRRLPGWASTLLRIILAALILIGLGALLTLYLLYVPFRDRNEAFQAELAGRAQSLESENAQLKDRITSLEPMEARNRELTAEISTAQARIGVLTLRTAVANAQAALALKQPDQVKQAFSQAPLMLDELEKVLPVEQRPVVSTLRSRLELTLSDLDMGDEFAAASDLDVLAKNLESLDTSLAQ